MCAYVCVYLLQSYVSRLTCIKCGTKVCRQGTDIDYVALDCVTYQG